MTFNSMISSVATASDGTAWKTLTMAGGYIKKVVTDVDVTAAYDTTKSYVVGDYCLYNGAVYRCTANTSGVWTASNWQASSDVSKYKLVFVQADGDEFAFYYDGRTNLDSTTLNLSRELLDLIATGNWTQGTTSEFEASRTSTSREW